MIAKNLLWVAFFVFVAAALWLDGHAALFCTTTPLAGVKLVVWATFAAFTAFSFYCSVHENLFETIAKMSELHWGRQIGLDLYLGLGLALFVIYLNEGSLGVMLLWLVPTLVYANLVTLLYVAIHFDQLVGRFL